jgi:hypothetical protein
MGGFFHGFLSINGQNARQAPQFATMLPLSAHIARSNRLNGLKMKTLTVVSATKDAKAEDKLAAQYRQIGSAAILAAVLAVTRQRELLASASKQAA